MSVEMTLVPVTEYDQLLKNAQWLAALECAGVDNWHGIEEAQRILNEWNGEENA